MRLRNFVLGLSECGAGALARVNGAKVSAQLKRHGHAPASLRRFSAARAAAKREESN
jgi:hypothetical protein